MKSNFSVHSYGQVKRTFYWFVLGKEGDKKVPHEIISLSDNLWLGMEQ